MLLAWTNSTSLALFSSVSQKNLDDLYRLETGSGVALFHSNSIPFVSQTLDLVNVNMLHTICSAFPPNLWHPKLKGSSKAGHEWLD